MKILFQTIIIIVDIILILILARYNKKSDINFTVPEPFDFLKKKLS